MIPHEYIEELTRRTDITELIGSYVQLKRKGRLYGGLCPFHSEKSPSFYVYPDTQSFYCFGCGAGGDAITFTKKINSIDYPEAVKLLAARAGMPEPEEDDKTGRMPASILPWRRPGRPGLTGGGAGWTIRPLSGSGWGMPPTTGRLSTSFCGRKATTSRSWTPAVCSSAASPAAFTACSGSG